MAALLQGRWSAGLDQTGLAQKGGPVVSDVRLGPAEPDGGAPRAAGGEVDVLLGLELLGAVAPETLRTLDPAADGRGRQHARDGDRGDGRRRRRSPRCRWPTASRGCSSATVADEALFVDAGTLAESLFGDHMPANVMHARRRLPARLPAARRRRRSSARSSSTGRRSSVNLAAFAWGRAVAADPAGALAQAADAGATPTDDRSVPAPIASTAVGLAAARAAIIADDRLAAAAGATAPPTSAPIRMRPTPGAIVDDVAGGARAPSGEPARRAATPVTEAYARSLHKLMAYKDEYEVARLHLRRGRAGPPGRQFGPGRRASR